MDKNILFSNSARVNSWGGGEKWTLTAAAAIIGQGGKAYLVCRKDSVTEQKATAAGIPVLQARFSNSLDLSSVFGILKIIQKYKIDLIICSTSLDIKLAGLAGKLAGIPVISRQGLALISDKLKYNILIKNFTSSIITNTISIKEQYEQYSWFPKNHIKVIYNGVKVDNQGVCPETIERLRHEYIKHPEEKILLSAGRLNPQKGFSFLIETAKLAQENKKNWRFLILGNGPLQNELQEKIDHHQLQNIQLIGFRENVKDYYAFADIFLLSSLSEGTPNVVLEAMANKLPVIATEVNGVKEVVKNGENGVSIPAKDPQAMYDAIDYLFEQPQLLQQFATNGYQSVIHDFSIQKFTEKFINYIQEVIHNYEKYHHQNA